MKKIFLYVFLGLLLWSSDSSAWVVRSKHLDGPKIYASMSHNDLNMAKSIALTKCRMYPLGKLSPDRCVIHSISGGPDDKQLGQKTYTTTKYDPLASDESIWDTITSWFESNPNPSKDEKDKKIQTITFIKFKI